MPSFWQIAQARAVQTQGVWSLSPTFTFAGTTKAAHAAANTALTAGVTAMDTAETTADNAFALVAADHATLRDVNKRALARLDSELDADSPLRGELDALGGIRQDTADDIERRAEKTIALWQRFNAARAAETPPGAALTIHGRTVAQIVAIHDGLGPKKLTLATGTSAFTGSRNGVRQLARTLDGLNKRWYKAWGSEFDNGSNELTALGDVDTEESTPPPTPLLIAAVTPQGANLHVTFLPGSAQHATVKDLLYKVEGVNVDYHRVSAAVAAGNTLGPFGSGQVVRLRTDVGNSRDGSVLGDEQVFTVTGSP